MPGSQSLRCGVWVAVFHVLSRARARSNPPSFAQDEEIGLPVLRKARMTPCGYQDVKSKRARSRSDVKQWRYLPCFSGLPGRREERANFLENAPRGLQRH